MLFCCTAARPLSSLGAQRRLNQATGEVSTSYERLSSGLRINRASDDAAGLSVATLLQVDSRIYSQGIKNINDGLSLLNVAQGALLQLSDITVRAQELAEQAANGVYSTEQRRALNEEAGALKDEYNRIVESTAFTLFDGPLSEGLRVQAGYGLDGSISFAIGEKLSRAVGDGTFASPMSFATGNRPEGIFLGDLNLDGTVDIVTNDVFAGSVSVLLGNGDGTFKARSSFVTGSGPSKVSLSDVNGDGILDIATCDRNENGVSILLGNGNGTFKARSLFGTGSAPTDVVLLDVNGDGAVDITASDYSGDTVSVLLGNGNGTFKARSSFSTGDGPDTLSLSDVNGDGTIDIAVATTNARTVDVLLGNGNGTFKARLSLGAGLDPEGVTLGDVSGDGIVDIVVNDESSDTVDLFVGNGNGTFKARITYATGDGPNSLFLADLNGDDVVDIATSDGVTDTVSLLFGNGDGTFKARSSFVTGDNPDSIFIGDLNGDGVADIATNDENSLTVSVLLGNAGTGSNISNIDLLSQASARGSLMTARATQERISAELGAIGGMQSRLGTALRNLSTRQENTIRASSRITDADIALGIFSTRIDTNSSAGSRCSSCSS